MQEADTLIFNIIFVREKIINISNEVFRTAHQDLIKRSGMRVLIILHNTATPAFTRSSDLLKNILYVLDTFTVCI